MHDIFFKALEELPELLKTREWQSTYITYEYPHVERLWLQYDEDHRLSLHRILKLPEAAEGEEEVVPLWHSHPWPSMFKVLSGDYKMMVASSRNVLAPLPTIGLQLAPGSTYGMNEHSWHSIHPEKSDVLSVMMTGKPFHSPIPAKFKPPVKQAELSPAQRESLMHDFLCMV